MAAALSSLIAGSCRGPEGCRPQNETESAICFQLADAISNSSPIAGGLLSSLKDAAYRDRCVGRSIPWGRELCLPSERVVTISLKSCNEEGGGEGTGMKCMRASVTSDSVVLAFMITECETY